MTFDDFYKNTKIKRIHSAHCAHKGKEVPSSPAEHKKQWLVQASAERGPEELPSVSSTWCPGRKSKLQNAEGFTSVTVLRKDHWSGVAAAPVLRDTLGF